MAKNYTDDERLKIYEELSHKGYLKAVYSDQFNSLSWSDQYKFLWFYQRKKFVGAIVFLIIVLTALFAAKLFFFSSSQSSSSTETSTNSQPAAEDSISLADGSYEFDHEVIRGRKKCETEPPGRNCLSLAQYKQLCGKVSGITKQVVRAWGFVNFGTSLFPENETQAFNTLLQNGNYVGVKSSWVEKDEFKPEAGIKGICKVTVSVSGNYDGNSFNLSDTTYADSFVVYGNEVLLHSGSSWLGIFRLSD